MLPLSEEISLRLYQLVSRVVCTFYDVPFNMNYNQIKCLVPISKCSWKNTQISINKKRQVTKSAAFSTSSNKYQQKKKTQAINLKIIT